MSLHAVTAYSTSNTSGHQNSTTLRRAIGGANVNAPDNDGKTALQEAAEVENHAVARLLIDHGADIESRDKNGATALHYEASSGHDVLVRLLFEYGTACEITTEDTAFYLASKFGHRRVLQSLLSCGADDEVKNAQMDRALHCTIDNGAPTVDIEIIRALVDHGSMVVDQNVDNMDPLQLTVKRNIEDVADILLQETAIDQDTVNGQTPFHATATFGRLDMVNILLENQADPNALNERQQTPLHQALGRRLRKPGIEDAWTESYNTVEELETTYDYDSEADNGKHFCYSRRRESR
ncbi:hypothetical protein ABVK25_008809 [Lepraria finkii]|uniref:Uncharacterized protein n=1 Tax=Lepraria finkii TaxID=1340010 RepID=A0ABR4B1X0_9LECA